MTLLITVFAAIFSTALWYFADNENMKLSRLAFMYWGASLMWFVDAVAEYFELGAAYFTPASEDMINDAFLGFSAVAFGLVIWLVSVLVTDPRGKIRNLLTSKN